jgi:hypothetical protein
MGRGARRLGCWGETPGNRVTVGGTAVDRNPHLLYNPVKHADGSVDHLAPRQTARYTRTVCGGLTSYCPQCQCMGITASKHCPLQPSYRKAIHHSATKGFPEPTHNPLCFLPFPLLPLRGKGRSLWISVDPCPSVPSADSSMWRWVAFWI